MRRPVIAITLCIDRGQRWRPGHDYLYVNRAYSQRVQEAGGTPFLVSFDTPCHAVLELCDAIIVTGGGDLPATREELAGRVEVSTHGALGAQASSAGAGRTAAEDAERIAWERALLDGAAGRALPVLGICYGMQLLNLHFGGKLYRELRTEHLQAIDHGGGNRSTMHGLRLQPSRLLSELSASPVVNSCHRQAVAAVAPGFSATAYGPDGIVEAIERDLFFGIEWHPETDSSGAAVFERFVWLANAP